MTKFNHVTSSITAKCLELILKKTDKSRPWIDYVEVKNNTIYATNGHVAIITSNLFALLELTGTDKPLNGFYLLTKSGLMGTYLFRPPIQPNITYPNIQAVINSAPTNSLIKTSIPGFLAKIKQSQHDTDQMPITLDYKHKCWNLSPLPTNVGDESYLNYTTVNAAFLAPWAGVECYIHANTNNPLKNIALTLDDKSPTNADLVYLICPLKSITPQPLTITHHEETK